MRTLALDLETYSTVNLVQCGVYRYADDPSFQILLCSYLIDDGEVVVRMYSQFSGKPI